MKTLFVFALAVLLGGCSSTTVINVIGGDAGVAEDGNDASADALVGPIDGAVGSARPDSGTDAAALEPPCTKGDLRCRDYKQEKCIVPADGWTTVAGEACCQDEARFVRNDDGTITDSKTGLRWMNYGGTSRCPDGWEHALIEESKTLLIGVGTCTPATDHRFFNVPFMCENAASGFMMNTNTGEKVPVQAASCSWWCVR